MSNPGSAPNLSGTPIPAAAQLVIDSEHRLRSENLSWDIDVWYPSVKDITFLTRFLPLTVNEAMAIISFHDVSWRHAKEALLPEEIRILRTLELSLERLIATFPGSCAFLRLCGRSPKDGEPLNRAAVLAKYENELSSLHAEGMPVNGNTKMIAITRASTLKVCNGKEAMSLLLTSERVYSDMLDWIKYGEPEQICLREWNEDLMLENEFRVFVHDNKITAISQYDHYTYLPSLHSMKGYIQAGIEHLWERAHPLINSSSYVVDIAFFPSRPPENQFTVIEFSPFLPCTGASLFSGTSDEDILEGRQRMEFRVKEERDLHPQLDDLVEINWDMRWQKPFTPYYHWFGETQSASTNIFGKFLRRIIAQFSREEFLENVIDESEFSEFLFVYGTLKSGFQWNEKYLSYRVGGLFVAPAITVPRLPLVVGDCGVPYVLGDIVNEESSEHIIGELWRVTPACLQNMDDYEGISKKYYSRDSIEVSKFLDDSKGLCDYVEHVTAHIYTLNNSTDDYLLKQPRLKEYTIEMHKRLYHATQHIQIKQKNYYKIPSTWGKTQRVFDESSYPVT